MARYYLKLSAISAVIERMFSISGNIITKSRNNLNPETVKQLTLLKSWKLKTIKEIQNQIN